LTEFTEWGENQNGGVNFANQRELTRIETGAKLFFIPVVQNFQNFGVCLLNLGTRWGG